MDFGALPPEVNSGRMYSGAGSAPLLGAAQAWNALAAELRAAAHGYASTIGGVSASWVGPSSTAMTGAAAGYIGWLTGTAEIAEQSAAHAAAAVAAYETVFAAMVPPPVIAANRAQVAALSATNIVGQHSAAIAGLEAAYVAMWSADATAMYRYAAQSAAAATLTPWTSPPQTTNPAAGSAQTLSHVAAAAGVHAALSHLTSTTPAALQSLTAPTSAATNSSSPQGLFSALDDFITGPLSPGELLIIPSTPQFAGIDTLGVVLAGSGLAEPATAGPQAEAISARIGGAGAIGALSVPPAWSAAAPAIKTAAAMLPANTAASVAPFSLESTAAALPSAPHVVGTQPFPASADAGQLIGVAGLSSLAGRGAVGSGGTARSMGLSSIVDNTITANVYFLTPEAAQ
jgi:PPE-repeat protein